MQILYKNETAKKQFCSEYKKKWRYPEQVKKKLEATENFIRNAESLMDVANYPPFHFEHLKGDRKDEWSIRLGNTGYRVTMIPCDNDGNKITEGDILAQCKMCIFRKNCASVPEERSAIPLQTEQSSAG